MSNNPQTANKTYSKSSELPNQKIEKDLAQYMQSRVKEADQQNQITSNHSIPEYQSTKQ